ncbi:MAG: hypothetical protein RL328_2316 [Acidobacteriota bacterium]|jgi:hypothetical protein
MLADYTRTERAAFAPLKTPSAIQRFLDESIGYNLEPKGATCYSPRLVLKHGVAHCMEGALFAAAALRMLGYPPLLVDLEAVRDSDHVLAVYRRDGRWGAIAKSNFAGLRSREPVYRSIGELAISYFEHYYNAAGEKTLRNHSRPVNLTRFDRRIQWMTTLEEVWEIPSYLCEVPHTPLVTPKILRNVARMDAKLYDANYVGHRLPGGASIRITPRPPQHSH